MSFVIDINQDQFLEEVVEKSKTTPVIVDFWAPWCGPCKQLTPVLENLVNKKKGKIILAKVNVDENQGIASQLNIQSIPTVYGLIALIIMFKNIPIAIRRVNSKVSIFVSIKQLK